MAIRLARRAASSSTLPAAAEVTSSTVMPQVIDTCYVGSPTMPSSPSVTRLTPPLSACRHLTIAPHPRRA